MTQGQPRNWRTDPAIPVAMCEEEIYARTRWSNSTSSHYRPRRSELRNLHLPIPAEFLPPEPPEVPADIRDLLARHGLVDGFVTLDKPVMVNPQAVVEALSEAIRARTIKDTPHD